MAESQGLGEGIRTMAKQASPSAIEPKLEEAMEKQPLLPHLLSFKVVGIAVAVGVVVALILTLLFSPMLGGVGLLIGFFATWFIAANQSYEKRRPTKDESDAESDSDESESDDEDDA